MQIAPKVFFIACIALFFTACPSNTAKNSNSSNRNAANANAGSSNANSIKDDIDELELTIKVPIHPEEVVWREETLGNTGDDRVPSPTDKKLIAVLRFLKDDANKLTAMAEKYKPAAPDTLSPEKWYPAELIAQSQTSGDGTLKGSSYAANDFYNLPYTDGKLTRIAGTDYFVLELFAK